MFCCCFLLLFFNRQRVEEIQEMVDSLNEKVTVVCE